MRPTDKITIIAHNGCRDGFAAAWIARRYFLARGVAVKIYFANYNTEPPWYLIDGRDVYILDFSYKRPVMDEIKHRARSLVVLDHHQTAQDDLEGFEGAIFDMNRSGAGMTWDYFYSDKKRPWLIDYVEDRDLWRFKLSNSQVVNAYISTLPYDYDAWDLALNQAEIADQVLHLGRAVIAKTKHYVSEVKKNAIRIDFEGYNVPLVNAPQVDISELVGELAEGEPFAMGWFQRSDGKFQYSLRSRGDIDVSAIAKKYGGGGHVRSSGFDVEFPIHLGDCDCQPISWKTCLAIIGSLIVLWVVIYLLSFV